MSLDCYFECVHVLDILDAANLPLVDLKITFSGEAEADLVTYLALSKFLSRLTTLQSVYLGLPRAPRLQEAILALRQLPELVHLEIQSMAGDEEDIEPGAPTENGFPALVSLDADIHTTSFPVSEFMSHINGKDLRDVKFMIPEDAYTNCALEGVERFTALESFDIRWDVWNVLDWEVLAPLLACHNLEDVYIHGTFASSLLNDQDMLSVAQSWPRLGRLAVEEEGDGDHGHLGRPSYSWIDDTDDLDPPSLRLQGITCLAKHCPSLTSLLISVDARQIPNPLPASIGVSVRDLVLFQCSAGESVEDTSNFICHMWPNIILKASNIRKDPWPNLNVVEERWGMGTF